MPIEREIKIIGADLAALRRTLQSLGAQCQGQRFERNELFDLADRSLRSGGRLLRLRRDGRTPGGALLTYKEPSTQAEQGAARGGAKVLREVQTGVDDAGALRRILSGLGLEPVLEYEKFREVWLLDGCEICLDRLPFGDFVELEGAEEALATLPGRLGLDGLEQSDASYHELNARHRQALGLPAADGFAFEPERREALAGELGVVLAEH